ncbi:MAG TPA: hypothetical protein DIW31_03365 [Bacteroidales bacterium]|nr:hypothetical protein [Bacteroidales bacterium]
MSKRFSIKRLKIKHIKLLIICLIAAFSISFYQFYNSYISFQKLKTNGIITTAKTEFIQSKYSFDHFKIEFVTAEGKTISRTKICEDKKTFEDEYSNLKIIYLHDEPNIYWELFYFKSYSVWDTFVFYFMVYAPLGGLLVYILIAQGLLLLKRKKVD